MNFNWLNLALAAVDRIPLEKLLMKPPDRSRDIDELERIYKRSQIQPERTRTNQNEPEPATESRSIVHQAHRHVHLRPPEAVEDGVTTEETVAYQNREIAKNLIVLEKHYAQKLTIGGKRCDCGAGRHLLAIESLCEETVSMVDNPDIYYRLLEWVGTATPMSTTEAAKSGNYDNEYPILSHQARDFRKEIIGSLDVDALYPGPAGKTRIIVEEAPPALQLPEHIDAEPATEGIVPNRNSPEWDAYATEQNRLSRERGELKVIELWKGEGVSGNDVVNLLRRRGVSIPESISKALQHDDTIVSATSVTGRGMSRSEASEIHKWVSENLPANPH